MYHGDYVIDQKRFRSLIFFYVKRFTSLFSFILPLNYGFTLSFTHQKGTRKATLCLFEQCHTE
jgi:hypothetical protein